jgi:ABC-2 type transport system ATP-binding protein
LITSQNLTKSFRVYQKEPGFIGSLKSLFKREYETRDAVSNFSIEIEPGEMLGLLGPNGAGKTTLMKMFTGIIVPSSGLLQIMGETPSARSLAFRKKIALVMGQKSQLWWDIPAMDSFLLLQKYYEIEPSKFRNRLNELCDHLGVQQQLQTQVRKLSLGERMKMELIASLLHEPDLIFLDEPTIGLDLVAQRNIRAFLADYQKEHKTTVILTSHYMADVAALCSRIVLILGGEKKFDGPIEQFETILGREKFVSLSFADSVDSNDPIWTKLDPEWNQGHTKVDLRIPEEKLREIASEILLKFPVTDIATEKLPIERVMHSLLDQPELIQKSNGNMA